MDIEGLDYNTQRKPLLMAEYGREIQNMVDCAVAEPDAARRQACAEAIVRLMGTKVPQMKDNSDFERTLWDHLYLMSGKRLDIAWPFDVSEAEKMGGKPQPMKHPKKGEHAYPRHYGRLLTETLERLKTMDEGSERDELTRLTANQMKRDLALWGHGSAGDERVADDLARLTDGRVQLDLSTFRFERVPAPEVEPTKKRKRK